MAIIQIISLREELRNHPYLRDEVHKIKEDKKVLKVTSPNQPVYYEMSMTEFSSSVYAVMKNADFTEGRGLMHLHELFHDYDKAVEYIMEQEGIMGSEQRARNAFGVSIYGTPYVVSGFNGYDIRPIQFKD